MPAEAKGREVPVISGMMLRFFRRVVRRYFKRHFRAVMVQHGERLAGMEGPLIVYGNHSSWWDPMVSVLLGEILLPERRHYAPMDAAALRRYPILGKLGMFGVEMSSPRGAAGFLRTSRAILESRGVVWITPQGRFVDPREAVLGFKPGLEALVGRVPGVRAVPLAIEYTFWDERLPETLLRVGEAVVGGAETTTAELEAALGKVMAELKVASLARDARAFEVLVTGGRGTGGFYAAGRRLRSWMTRRPVAVDHTVRGEGGER
jgi:1-acyl-sn-glycerol-3-phosphate acyltransferase